MNWITADCKNPCQSSRMIARQRQQQLTKPPGSLGRLEQLAEDFAAWQSAEKPSLDKLAVRVFAADHGVCVRGVSAFPPEVTLQMIANFLSGGAAISVLCRAANADFAVINMGTTQPSSPAPGLVNAAIAPGTADFTRGPAMTTQELHLCLDTGASQVDSLDCELFIAGEMGIGNTTSASTITAAVLGLPATDVIGRGTGIDDETLMRKCEAIEDALSCHKDSLDTPLAVLRCVGGLEIAAMCGAFIRCGQRGIPILLDGFIASSAALLAVRINPGVAPWLIAGHQSAEPAHRRLLDALELSPLLQLDMRLGEGSGAAMAIPVIQSALLLHRQMATFGEAGVADSN